MILTARSIHSRGPGGPVGRPRRPVRERRKKRHVDVDLDPARAGQMTGVGERPSLTSIIAVAPSAAASGPAA